MFLKLCTCFSFFAFLFHPAFLRAENDPSIGGTHSIIKQIPQRWLIEVKSTDSPSYNDSLRSFIRQYNPGGIIYKSWIDLASVGGHQRSLQSSATTPLLVGLDLSDNNQGTRNTLHALSSWLSLAATQDSLLIAEYARQDAHRLKEQGVHMLILDPFRLSFTSGFGERPAEAVQAASAYVSGMRAQGIDVIISMSDSEPRLPLEQELNLLQSLDIMGIDTHAITTLTGSGIKDVNKLLKASRFYPMTISKWPDQKGLDVDMKRPGSDFLVLSSLDAVEGVFERRINKKRQALAVVKIAQWKMGELVKASNSINPFRLDEMNERKLARESAILLTNTDSLLPFRNLGKHDFAATFFGEQNAEVFLSIVDKYVPLTRYTWNNDLEQFRQNEDRIVHFSVYIAAVDLHWYQQLPLSQQSKLKEMLYRLQEQNTRVVLVLFGDVELVSSFDGFDYLSYHPETSSESFEIAPQLLFGAYAYSGQWLGPQHNFKNSLVTQALARLRYGDPWRQTLNISRLNKIDSMVQEAILDKAIPGCQILIAKNGSVLYEKSFGYLSYDSLLPVTENTLYDLASLTKVTATLQMMMKLVEENKIDLNAPLSAYLPETVGTNKESLIISDILLHRAGLRPYIPFWEFTYQNRRKSILNPLLYNPMEAEEYPVEILPGMYTSTSLRDSVWYWTLHSDLMTLPEGQSRYSYKYSDLGFMIIQKLVERVGQSPLDEYVYNELYKPLGIDQICFQPLCSYSYENIAPTELDYYFRKDMIWGSVHDQNAALMGGIAGHAGLFGTSNSLAVLLQMHLQKGYYGGQTFFQPETIELFTQRKADQDQRALGWDLKDLSNTRNNVSFHSSETTYGHTGFTGTAAWVDPGNELIYIFLSNRVHPDANNYKLVESNLRTRIQDVIYQSLQEPLREASVTSDGKLTSGD